VYYTGTLHSIVGFESVQCTGILILTFILTYLNFTDDGSTRYCSKRMKMIFSINTLLFLTKIEKSAVFATPSVNN